MLNFKRILRQFGSTDGSEIAEAAVVLPLVFTFLLGIVWFGRAFNIYATITQAAQQGAIVAARATGGAQGNALPDPDLEVDPAVVSVLSSSSLATGQVNEGPKPNLLPCPAPAPQGLCKPSKHHIWVCSSVLVNSATQPAQCGAVVSFQYPFQFYLPFTSLNLEKITLSAQAQSRMEN